MRPLHAARELAEAIADDLFTNSQGQHAERLALVVDHTIHATPGQWSYTDSIGGWSKVALVDRIMKHLDEHER